jgi:hypothetical protein
MARSTPPLATDIVSVSAYASMLVVVGRIFGLSSRSIGEIDSAEPWFHGHDGERKKRERLMGRP